MTALGTNQEIALGSNMLNLHYATAGSQCRLQFHPRLLDRYGAHPGQRALFLSGLLGDAAPALPIHLTIPIDITGRLSG